MRAQDGAFTAGLGSSPGLGSSGQQRKRRRPRAFAAPQAPGEASSSSAEAAQRPVEEHVLIQQWGFEITLSIIPLGWKEQRSSATDKGKAPLENHNTYNNPLYTSEDTSASSVSDDAGALHAPYIQV